MAFCTLKKGTTLGYPGAPAVATITEEIRFARPGLTLLAGRNGEGKSTLMRHLCFCQDQKPDQSYRHAYLPEDLLFDPEMRPATIARAVLSSATQKQWFLTQATETLLPDKAFGTLSKGNKQKVRNLLTIALAREMDADLLCLDEAMSGLDYFVRREFWCIIAGEASMRHVVLSLHPDDICAEPNQILLICGGKVSRMETMTSNWLKIEEEMEIRQKR